MANKRRNASPFEFGAEIGTPGGPGEGKNQVGPTDRAGQGTTAGQVGMAGKGGVTSQSGPTNKANQTQLAKKSPTEEAKSFYEFSREFGEKRNQKKR